MDRSRLFWIDANPHDFLPKHVNNEEVALLQETFFLPFPVTAIEDTAGVVILTDEDKDAKGLSAPRGFVEFLLFDTPI